MANDAVAKKELEHIAEIMDNVVADNSVPRNIRSAVQDAKTKAMEKVIALALTESLHKRITYLKGEKIITLSEYTKKHGKSAPALLNASRRQNIPAFREKGVWKIGENFKPAK